MEIVTLMYVLIVMLLVVAIEAGIIAGQTRNISKDVAFIARNFEEGPPDPRWPHDSKAMEAFGSPLEISRHEDMRTLIAKLDWGLCLAQKMFRKLELMELKTFGAQRGQKDAVREKFVEELKVMEEK